jgi:hypothetical protein
MNEAGAGKVMAMSDLIDGVFQRWSEANRDWLKAHGPTATGDDVRNSAPAIFREAVGPYLQMIDDIERLRAGEGNAVTIICDNPDFNGLPNSEVECSGDWTNWTYKEFTGDTLAEALRNAALARAHVAGRKD